MQNQYLDIARRLRLQRGEPASRRDEPGAGDPSPPGRWIVYHDPLFGHRRGEVIGAQVDRVEIVPPLGDRLLTIPAAWIVSVCGARP
jgi:hypothetical protein